MRMRAKMNCTKVVKYEHGEEFYFTPVTGGKFAADGVDEDNTYSKYSPSGDLRLMVTNPAIIGTINPGDVFYVDFTLVER